MADAFDPAGGFATECDCGRTLGLPRSWIDGKPPGIRIRCRDCGAINWAEFDGAE